MKLSNRSFCELVLIVYFDPVVNREHSSSREPTHNVGSSSPEKSLPSAFPMDLGNTLQATVDLDVLA
jgi:hypothetical protein